MLPAVAVNVAELAPAGTVAVAGTVNPSVLLESETDAPPAPAVLDSVAVQVDVPPEARLVGVHDSRLRVTGAISEIEAV
jgi:hypothetical protein